MARRGDAGSHLMTTYEGSCSRGCCWTPYGHSGLVNLCGCHPWGPRQ